MPSHGALLIAAGGLIAAYLLGSLPFGYIIARCRGVDIRSVGSGNIGATNVGRVCGRQWGIFVFLLDAAKGFLAAGPLVWAVLRAGVIPDDLLISVVLAPVYAVAVFSGHVWPVFLGFRGGKGVATGAGAVLALAPLALLAGMLMWGTSLFMTRYMSVASMAGAVTVAAVNLARTWYRGRLAEEWPVWGLTAVLAVLVILRHRANIGRLMRGQELKIGSSRARETGTENA